MFDRRLLQNFDWGLLGITLILCATGLLVLYSAVLIDDPQDMMPIFYKQIAWLGIGLFLMALMLLFSYKSLDKWALSIYGLTVLLLVCVLVFGRQAGGSTRWLAMGPFTFQPSELVKVGVIIVLARYFAKNVKQNGMGLRDLLIPMGLTAAPFFLVLIQPDLGTAGTIALIAASMALFVKIHRRTWMCFILIAIVAIPVGWHLLYPYQRDRVLTLLSPEKDPLGAGYHIRQSKIAVGSGLILGKGYLNGTQKKLSFLPEQHTDFIFSVLSEEWGFAGSMFLIFLFVVLMAFGINIAHSCRDSFGAILCVGVTAMIFWQVFINIGMVTGIMPVVGMPLPLVSYGGSSVITLLIGIGILMNVSMRRFLN